MALHQGLYHATQTGIDVSKGKDPDGFLSTLMTALEAVSRFSRMSRLFVHICPLLDEGPTKRPGRGQR